MFTAADFDTPQTITVSPVLDTDKELTPHSGLVRFSVSSSTPSNYDGVTRNDLIVDIADDDMPTLNVGISGTLEEGVAGNAIVSVTRSGISSTGLDQVVTFSLSGTR